MSRRVLFTLCAFLLYAFSAAPAYAGAVMSGFNSSVLGANDDGSTGSVSLGFTANFFGNSYTTAYLNNNGNITFNSAMSTYTPYGIGAGYTGSPIIAAFFADVDTRGVGSALMAYGYGTVGGHDAFGVTWPGVGYYFNGVDRLNTFQLILVDRSDIAAGDFDILFNYDSIQWETGDASGGTDGLGGTSAAVGYSNGTGVAGSYYQFAGSMVNGALLDGGSNALASNTNDGVVGQYLFEVRSGQVTPAATPEPTTMLLMGLGAVTGAIIRRRQKSETM